MRKYGKGKTHWWVLREWLQAGESFANSTRTFRGGRGEQSLFNAGKGRLPVEWVQSFDNPANNYVIYSYGTPIAWHHPTTGWVVPDVKYSVTTTYHQGQVRTAVNAK